jgi:hypothetical protein
MISSEASASEFAINSAITAAISRHDTPHGPLPSDASPIRALDLAKGPSRHCSANAARYRIARDANLQHFPVLADDFGFDARLVHWLIIY